VGSPHSAPPRLLSALTITAREGTGGSVLDIVNALALLVVTVACFAVAIRSLNS
jgi:hypothetical protein